MKLVVSFFILTLLICVGSPQRAFCQTRDTEKALGQKAMGDSYLRKGKTSLAITQYEKALSFNPSSTAICFNLAVAQFLDKNPKGAIATLEKLVVLDPHDVEAHYNLASLYLSERNLEKAKEHIEKAKLCCDRIPSFAALVKQSHAFISELGKLDPASLEIAFLFVKRDLWSTAP